MVPFKYYRCLRIFYKLVKQPILAQNKLNYSTSENYETGRKLKSIGPKSYLKYKRARHFEKKYGFQVVNKCQKLIPILLPPPSSLH